MLYASFCYDVVGLCVFVCLFGAFVSFVCDALCGVVCFFVWVLAFV